MKTIYSSNKELTETFNKQAQSYGKANSLFFEGKFLYSYGYHYPLAIIQDSYILINDRGYSVTTSKHISIAKNVTSNRKQILTSEIELGQVLQQLEQLEYRLNKARKPEIYRTQIQSLYKAFVANQKYLGGFYVGFKSMFSGLRFDFINHKEASAEQREKLEAISKIFCNSLKIEKIYSNLN